MKRVLFICLGNICRSPAGEAVFKQFIENKGISSEYEVDSAGTSAFHEGNQADERMRDHARKRGIEITSISRGLRDSDFEEFDFLITMDKSNYRNTQVHANRSGNEALVKKIIPFCEHEEVPDPYYGGADGFEYVLDMLEREMPNLLDRMK